jgi:hypothetical protein
MTFLSAKLAGHMTASRRTPLPKNPCQHGPSTHEPNSAVRYEYLGRLSEWRAGGAHKVETATKPFLNRFEIVALDDRSNLPLAT